MRNAGNCVDVGGYAQCDFFPNLEQKSHWDSVFISVKELQLPINPVYQLKPALTLFVSSDSTSQSL